MAARRPQFRGSRETRRPRRSRSRRTRPLAASPWAILSRVAYISAQPDSLEESVVSRVRSKRVKGREHVHGGEPIMPEGGCLVQKSERFGYFADRRRQFRSEDRVTRIVQQLIRRTPMFL